MFLLVKEKYFVLHSVQFSLQFGAMNCELYNLYLVSFPPLTVQTNVNKQTLVHMLTSKILASLDFNKNKILSPGLENNHS